jgi:hypothetical protein
MLAEKTLLSGAATLRSGLHPKFSIFLSPFAVKLGEFKVFALVCVRHMSPSTPGVGMIVDREVSDPRFLYPPPTCCPRKCGCKFSSM